MSNQENSGNVVSYDAKDIWHMRNSGYSYPEVAKKFGISASKARRMYNSVDVSLYEEQMNSMSEEQKNALLKLEGRVSGLETSLGSGLNSLRTLFKDEASSIKTGLVSLNQELLSAAAEEKARNEKLDQRLAAYSQTSAEATKRMEENYNILDTKLDDVIAKSKEESANTNNTINEVVAVTEKAIKEIHGSLYAFKQDGEHLHIGQSNMDARLDNIVAQMDGFVKKPSKFEKARRYAIGAVAAVILGAGAALGGYFLGNAKSAENRAYADAQVAIVDARVTKEVNNLEQKVKDANAKSDAAVKDETMAREESVEKVNGALTGVNKTLTESQEALTQRVTGLESGYSNLAKIVKDNYDVLSAKQAENLKDLKDLARSYVNSLPAIQKEILEAFGKLEGNVKAKDDVQDKDIEDLMNAQAKFDEMTKELNDSKSVQDEESKRFAEEQASKAIEDAKRIAEEQAMEQERAKSRISGGLEARFGAINGDGVGQSGQLSTSAHSQYFDANLNAIYNGVNSKLGDGTEFRRNMLALSLDGSSYGFGVKLNGGRETENQKGNGTEQDFARNAGSLELSKDSGDIIFSLKYGFRDESTKTRSPIFGDIETNMSSFTGKVGYNSDKFGIGAVLRDRKTGFRYEIPGIAKDANGINQHSAGLFASLSGSDRYFANALLLQNFGDVSRDQRLEVESDFGIRIGEKLIVAGGYGRESGEDKGRGLISWGNDIIAVNRFLGRIEEDGLFDDVLLKEQKFWRTHNGLAGLGKNGPIIFGEKGKGDNFRAGISTPLFLKDTFFTGYVENSENENSLLLEPGMNVDGKTIGLFLRTTKQKGQGTTNEVGGIIGGNF